MGETNTNGITVYDEEKNVKGREVPAAITQSFSANNGYNLTSTDNEYPSVRTNRPKSAKGRSRNELKTTTVTVSGLEETDKSKLPTEQLSASPNISLKRNETFKTRLERRDFRKAVARSKSVGSPEKFLANTPSLNPLKQFHKSMTIENNTFLTNRSRFVYSDREAENTVERIITGTSSQTNNFEQDKYFKEDKLKANSKREAGDILKDAILYSENRSLSERPKSSYGRARTQPQNDAKERLLRRRPTSASDLAASRRSNIIRTKHGTHHIPDPILDDTLSETGNSSDSLEEVKLLETSSIPRSSKSLTNTREFHRLKESSYSPFHGYKQNSSNGKENRPSERKTLKHENHFTKNKASRMQIGVKRSSTVYESHKLMSTLQPDQRSSTPVPDRKSYQGGLNTINKTLSKTLDGLKSTTTSANLSSSIADRIRERLTSTNHNQSSHIVHGHLLSEEFCEPLVSHVRAQHSLSRSKTVGLGDKYNRKSANQTDRQAVLHGHTDTARDFLPTYKSQDVMTASNMQNMAEKLKERTRYSHQMRSKSFHFNT